MTTNEINDTLQDKANLFYQNKILKHLAFPSIKYRLIYDTTALKEDLSNVNIWAFVTMKGNLWTSKFLEKAKDFPIKITDTSIVAKYIYKGKNQILSAIWYNPDNCKHAVAL